MQMVHSEPIFCRVCADLFPKIVCNFCLQSSDLRYTWHFCHESLVVQGMWCGSFPSFTGDYIGGFFFLYRKDPGDNTVPLPPPNILKKCNIHYETIFSRLNICILSKGVCGVVVFFWGGGALKGAVFLWFGNFWEISTILQQKVQGT